jgi:putative transposase
VLNILDVPRSTYYHRRNYRVEEKQVSEGRPAPGYSITNDDEKISDEQIKEWLLEEIAGEGYAYGYRKLTKHLRRKYKLVINKKKVYRLCKELNILRPQRQKKSTFPRKLARNRTITGSNQLWETDIKYDYITGEDRFFFILSYIDVYDRSIIDYHIGLSCTGKNALQTLQRALMKRNQYATKDKPVVRSDNGPQFISHAFSQGCETLEVEHERIPPKTPNMNAHIESFHRILEDDCLSRFEFASFEESYKAVSEFMKFYNEVRMRGSIKDMSPTEFYERSKHEAIRIKEVRV